MSKGNSNHDVQVVDGGGDLHVQVLLETSGVFSKLVPDIFLDIMSRVPLKSLSQCRWVCKAWYNLIQNPSFATIHYEWAIKNNSPWLFFWSTTKILYLLDDQVFDNLETSVTPHRLELNGFNQALGFRRVFQAAGYVNGLICLASDPKCYSYHPSSIYVCNPITGEHIIIPKSPLFKIPAVASFGFDPTTNEYKVIRLIHDEDMDGEHLSSEGEVYTLGSSEWRKIEDVPHIMGVPRCGVLLNGSLHWISGISDSPIISAFNVGSEKFDVIQLPFHILDHSCRHLVVVEGHLCLLHNESHDKPYEIWAMEDYGVQSSWIKKYSFNTKVCTWLWVGTNDMIKLRNGEFLLHFEIHNVQNEFIGYFDPKKDTLRRIKIIKDRVNNEFWFNSVLQVGSLFSPKDVGKSRRGKEGNSLC